MARSFYLNTNEQRTAAKESLNQYLKKTSVTPLMMLIGAVMLMAGMIVWATTAGLKTDISAVIHVEKRRAICFVDEEEMASNGLPIVGETAYVNGIPCKITSVDEIPFQATSIDNTYMMHLGGIKVDDWVYQFTMEGNLPEGVYHTQIVTGNTTAAKLLLRK